MKLNKLMGLELTGVENILKNKDIKYRIRETKGYKDVGILNIPRVIKIEEKENNIELIITYFSNSLE